MVPRPRGVGAHGGAGHEPGRGAAVRGDGTGVAVPRGALIDGGTAAEGPVGGASGGVRGTCGELARAAGAGVLPVGAGGGVGAEY